jgi:hypothetical protein
MLVQAVTEWRSRFASGVSLEPQRFVHAVVKKFMSDLRIDRMGRIGTGKGSEFDEKAVQISR